MEVQDFDTYEWRGETPDTEELIFCTKEFKAMLQLCEAIDAGAVTLLFTQGGR
jgi:Rad9